MSLFFLMVTPSSSPSSPLLLLDRRSLFIVSLFILAHALASASWLFRSDTLYISFPLPSFQTLLFCCCILIAGFCFFTIVFLLSSGDTPCACHHCCLLRLGRICLLLTYHRYIPETETHMCHLAQMCFWSY
jgi:hypothetical protein